MGRARRRAVSFGRSLGHVLGRPGLLVGLLAALGITLLMLVLRDATGLPSTAELVGDRVASLLPIELFLALLSLVGGFNNLKAIGVIGVLTSGCAAGAAAGLLCERVIQGERRARRSHPMHPTPFSWRGAVLLCAVALGVWLAATGALWSHLPTHFGGLPPDTARRHAVAALLALCLTFVPAFLLLYHQLLSLAVT